MGKLILFEPKGCDVTNYGHREYWINPKKVLAVCGAYRDSEKITQIITGKRIFRVKGDAQSAVMRLNKAAEKGVDHG